MDFRTYSHLVNVASVPSSQVMDWGVSAVQAPEAWSKTKGEGVKVAVMDTGIDYLHPDLVPNFKGGVNFTTPDPNDMIDRQGHGTHCAGIIAGCDNTIGVVGIAPMAELYAIKVLGDNGGGKAQSLIDGIDWAIENDMDILSMSLGGGRDPGPSLHDAIKRAYRAGLIVVAAAGNESRHVGWPAVYEEVIAVGAVDSALSKASFSNYGSELDVVAPGVDIYSTYPNGAYATLSGTSMATPVVSGIIALLLSYSRKNGIVLAPQSILDTLTKRAEDLGVTGDDDMFGHGFLRLSNLLAVNEVTP